jgi:hypothetical protein
VSWLQEAISQLKQPTVLIEEDGLGADEAAGRAGQAPGPAP